VSELADITDVDRTTFAPIEPSASLPFSIPITVEEPRRELSLPVLDPPPTPVVWPREVDAPATSVTARPPPLPTSKARLRNISVIAAAAIVLGIAARWATSAQGSDRAAAGEVPLPPRQAAPPLAQGVLEVSAPEGAGILVDGTERGRGPKISVNLAAGSHEVRTSIETDKTRTVEIARGRITHVDLKRGARF
jgi:hypothetical protein